MAALSLATHRSFFNSTVYKVVEKLEGMQNDPIFDLCGEVAYDDSTGDTINFASRTLDGYAQRVAPGGEIPESSTVEGDTLAKPFVSYKDKMVVEMETALHNKLDLVLEDAEALAERTLNIIALELSHQLLNSADSDTLALKGGGTAAITCADGLALASASHTVPGTGATTYSNLLSAASALSEDNMSTLIQQGKANNVSDAGTIIPFIPDTIVIPDNEDMIKKALQITGSELVSESANNAINVYNRGKMRVVVLKHAPRNAIGGYDTDQQYHWAVADSRQLKRAIKYSWALRPSEIGSGLVPKFRESNLDSVIYTAARFVFGAPRWQGIYFSMSTTKPTHA